MTNEAVLLGRAGCPRLREGGEFVRFLNRRAKHAEGVQGALPDARSAPVGADPAP